MSKTMFWLGLGSLLLFLVALSITLTINSTWLYRLNVNYGNFLPLVNLSATQMMDNFKQLLAYLNYPWVTKLVMANFTDSASALEHFRQVKQLFLINYLVMFGLSGPSVWFVHQLWRRQEQWRLLRPLQWIFILIFGLVVMMITQFNQFFITFHKVLFHNNDWEFYPAQDPIINALPESYFNQTFALFFILISLFLFILYRWSQRFFSKK